MIGKLLGLVVTTTIGIVFSPLTLGASLILPIAHIMPGPRADGVYVQKTKVRRKR